MNLKIQNPGNANAFPGVGCTLFQSLFDSNSNANGHTDHGVVTCAQEAHHFHVGRDGGRTSELCITVHTAHGIGQAVRSGTCSHVIGVQGTAGAHIDSQ